MVTREEAVVSIPTALVLTIVTCGIYAIFWRNRQMKAVNALIGQEKYNIVTWLLLSIVTCGIYAIYTLYMMAQDITAAQKAKGLPSNDNLSLLSVLLSVFGLVIVVDALHQVEINKLYE